MPDFNKGDFTQQGIAGDVTSLVRLNEKRTVKLTLSADDASDNCDISGSVIDELNGKTYPIGAGVSGNIEITENTAEGETLNIAQYATATVNVSGGGNEPIVTEIRNFVANNLSYITEDERYEQSLAEIMVPLDTMGENPYTILVTFDGTDYLCPFDRTHDIYGAPFNDNFTEIPFRIRVSAGGKLECATEGPHTLKISLLTEPGTLTIISEVSNLQTSLSINSTNAIIKDGVGVINTLLIGGVASALSYTIDSDTLSYNDLIGCFYDADSDQIIITNTTASVRITLANNV